MRIRAAVIALATAGSLVATMGPALAAGSAEERMLTKQDVPASFGTPTSYDFDAKIIGKAIGICDNASGQTLVSVAAPPKQFLVDIETKNKRTYTDVMERVYQFESEAKAQDAFTELSGKMSACDGTSTLKQGGPNLKQTVTTGSYPGGQYQDFWVNVSGTWTGGDLKKPSQTVLRAMYVQAGNALIETVAYVNGRSALTSQQIDDLADLAEVLAGRWVS
jgi:hypothetical protein